MNDRPDGTLEPNGGETGSANMMWLLGQLLMIPVAAFVYGVELLGKTMQGMQRATTEGMEVMAGTRSRSSEVPESDGPPIDKARVHRDIDLNDSRTQPIQTIQKEETALTTNDGYATGTDKDLHDDMLKLVRYKVLFVRREYEVAFPEREDLVSDNMDGAAFAAWKVAEFIQELAKKKTDVPSKWGERYPAHDRGTYVTEDGKLFAFPDEDKKYLRVYYQVLDRYPREKFKYEEQQIRVLEQIRDKISDPGVAGSAKSKA